ncbi:MAG: hypothetical protein LBC07_03785 [Elusimicrobiota bacterium]|jgi:hypothetical protein|nr:hypothetical protein [Elusimicrobiota bacterium]
MKSLLIFNNNYFKWFILILLLTAGYFLTRLDLLSPALVRIIDNQAGYTMAYPCYIYMFLVFIYFFTFAYFIAFICLKKCRSLLKKLTFVFLCSILIRICFWLFPTNGDVGSIWELTFLYFISLIFAFVIFCYIFNELLRDKAKPMEIAYFLVGSVLVNLFVFFLIVGYMELYYKSGHGL